MDRIGKSLAEYARQVIELASSSSSNEATFYPAIQGLLTDLLREAALPFEVRVNTSQRRTGGGADQPDLAFYDGAGDFPVVLGEVKSPGEELADLAFSADRQDQVGRYLSRTGVVLLTNIRSFALLTREPSFTGRGPVPPEHRRLLEVVDLWPSATAMRQGRAILPNAASGLAEQVETAVTEFATIAEPESLARVLARQARRAKADLPTKFSRAVQPLLDDFAKALGLHFEGSEGEEFLRSSLIQTAFYGLFAGWTLWRHSGATKPFRWEDLADYLKIPFLGSLFHEFRHPIRLKELRLAPHLDRAKATLDRVIPERFFARFVMPQVRIGAQEQSTASSAILYFYEPFLEAFDPELRKQLGVWYTPQEIVRYQVRKVDHLLREELACERGFADDRVVVLDPCCGTGAYLIEVLRCLAEQLEQEGAGALLGSKLLNAFCRRIIGFEILTAPFVIAQLQLYLILSDLGVEPDATHRPAIFLTNALTGWEGPEQLKLQFPELQEEHDAARRIKREEKIIVILGNPPYNRFAGVPPAEEEAELVDHYKGIRRNARGKQIETSALYKRFGIRKQLLDDLYIRFIRLAESRIGEKGEYGIVSFISNYSYLTGRSHPLMRESLLRNFDQIWIDSLNGDKFRTGKVIPEGLPGEGSSDQSVFSTEQDARGIQLGTAIATFLKRGRRSGGDRVAAVSFREFWGLSSLKRQALLVSLDLSRVPERERARLAIAPEGPRDYEPIIPTERNRWKLIPRSVAGGYEDWPALDELFPVHFHGVNTNRGTDGSLIEIDKEKLVDRMREYFSSVSWGEFARKHPVLATPRSRYEPERVRSRLRAESRFDDRKVKPYVQYPLDLRWIYYETQGKLISEHGPDFARNLSTNHFLVTVPQPRQISETRPMLLSSLFGLHVHDRGAVAFPVHFRVETLRDLFSQEFPQANPPRANCVEKAWIVLKEAWKLTGGLEDADAKQLVTKLFNAVLAVAHSPLYESDHQEALAQDWLHVPIPRSPAILAELSQLGRLVSTLLDPVADPAKVLRKVLGSAQRNLALVATRERTTVREGDLLVTISYFGSAPGKWCERRAREGESFQQQWGELTGDLSLNDSVYLQNVPERVWHYELGGYPVIKKWLGSRDAVHCQGRPLTLKELDYLREMIHRIAALLLLREELNAWYERASLEPFTAEELGLR